MRINVHIFWILITLSLVAGCSKKKNDCMKSTGKIVFEERTVGSFKTLEVYNNVNVIVTHGTTYAVTVEAGENLLEKITVDVKGDTLVIKNKNK